MQHLTDLIDTQRSERYRAFIVHGGAMTGKTRIARRLAERLPDAEYHDTLQAFLAHPDMCSQIDRFRPDDLTKYLLKLDAPGQVIVVDHLDFLLNTWTRPHRQAFARWVDEGLDGFSHTDKVFAFFIQTDPDIISYQMRRRNKNNQTRIFALEDFYAL
jgi:hypothetical protein